MHKAFAVLHKASLRRNCAGAVTYTPSTLRAQFTAGALLKRMRYCKKPSRYQQIWFTLLQQRPPRQRCTIVIRNCHPKLKISLLHICAGAMTVGDGEKVAVVVGANKGVGLAVRLLCSCLVHRSCCTSARVSGPSPAFVSYASNLYTSACDPLEERWRNLACVKLLTIRGQAGCAKAVEGGLHSRRHCAVALRGPASIRRESPRWRVYL